MTQGLTTTDPREPVELSSMDMSDLIRAANAHHARIESLEVSALDHAFCVGAALSEAKSRLDHGEWLPWLEANFCGGRSTAAKYMRLYERQGELPKCSATLHLTIDQAAKLLSAPKPKPEPKPRREPQPEPDDAPAEVVERRAAPISQEPVPPPASPVDLAGAVQRHINDVVGRWPKGQSYHMLLGVLSQSYTRVKALEVKFNGGAQ